MMGGSIVAVAKARAAHHIPPMRFSTLLPCLCLAVLPATGEVKAASSDWHHVEGGSIRVVTSGRPDATGHLRGALEIRLKPGWKTYWLDPGASGVPPTLAAAVGGEEAAVEMSFPAPRRFDDGYAQWAGYDHPVSLALKLALPAGSTAPARLQANIFLGVCETICIPVQATLTVDPRAGADDPEHAAVVEDAFAALPNPARPGFSARVAEVEDKAVVVEAAVPEGVRALDLFVAGTQTLALGAPEKAAGGSRTLFRVPLSADLAARPGGEEVPYTLVTDAGAVSGRLKLP